MILLFEELSGKFHQIKLETKYFSNFECIFSVLGAVLIIPLETAPRNENLLPVYKIRQTQTRSLKIYNLTKILTQKTLYPLALQEAFKYLEALKIADSTDELNIKYTCHSTFY